MRSVHVFPVLLILLLSPAAVVPAAAVDPNAPDPDPSRPEDVDETREPPRASVPGNRAAEAWTNLRDDGRYLITFPLRPTRKGVLAAFLAGGGILTLVLLDDEIRSEIQDRRTPALDRWERRIEPLGHLRNTTLAALAVYGGGRIFGDEEVAETGRTLIESLLYAESFNLGAKGLFGRRPPAGGGRASDFFDGSSFFPSGHTARAFAFATVLSRRHGRRAAWVAYPLATLVGLSRMERDVHWASDVFAGAALGYVVARSVTARRADREGGRPQVGLTAGFVPGGTALLIQLRWD